MVCEGTTASVEPVDDIFIGLDLTVIPVGHQALGILGSKTGDVEIGKATSEQVVIESITAVDMSEGFFSLRD